VRAAFPSLPISRRRATSQGAARANARAPHAIALLREGAVVFEHREVARLTMRAFSDAFLEVILR